MVVTRHSRQTREASGKAARRASERAASRVPIRGRACAARQARLAVALSVCEKANYEVTLGRFSTCACACTCTCGCVNVNLYLLWHVRFSQ